jgi:hypothetical protein
VFEIKNRKGHKPWANVVADSQKTNQNATEAAKNKK